MFDEDVSADEDMPISHDQPGPRPSNNSPEHFVGEVGSERRGGESDSEASDFVRVFDSEASDLVRLFEKARSPVYSGCTNMSALDFLAELMHLKVSNQLSNKTLDMLLQFLNKALPEGAKLPVSHHDAKKMLQDFGLGYVIIHACKYDCALLWKEHASCGSCPVCNEPRYKYENGKGEKIPQKVLFNFPLKPRLQRLFMSKDTATDMRWHKENRVDVEEVFNHPADTEEWKDFDKKYPWFAKDARNV